MSDHITVCVCTFRRTRLLTRLLRNLASQNTRDLFDISVVVVDNDPSGSARKDVEQQRLRSGLDIVYDVEPVRSIPAARNRAIRLAKGDFIAIIDDDEFPSSHWLVALYEAVKNRKVDGALGPVYPFFEEPPPIWLTKSKMLELPSLPTGSLLKWWQTRTGNVLLKKDIFSHQRIQFDEKFKTGGSDQDFFRRVIELGCRFVWVSEAPVYETVGPDRWSKNYFLRRALVNGFNSHKYGRSRANVIGVSSQTIKSALLLPAYAISTPFSACLGAHVLINCMEKLYYHASRVVAVFGIELWKKRDF